MAVKPGIHPELDFFTFEKKEEALIKQFSTVFFITFAKAARFKEGNYTFAFGKPSNVLTERFHLEREVLILISPYRNFEGRVLDFVDKTIFEFQNRLDKLLVILVSADEKIEEKITNIVLQIKSLEYLFHFMSMIFRNQHHQNLLKVNCRNFSLPEIYSRLTRL